MESTLPLRYDLAVTWCFYFNIIAVVLNLKVKVYIYMCVCVSVKERVFYGIWPVTMPINHLS